MGKTLVSVQSHDWNGGFSTLALRAAWALKNSLAKHTVGVKIHTGFHRCNTNPFCKKEANLVHSLSFFWLRTLCLPTVFLVGCTVE